MNYEKIYSELIFRAKNRTILPTEYKETHHILPKSMYPEYKKTKWNLVNLLPEEHLIAHLLLVKIYPNEKGLTYAAFRMTGYKKLSSKDYGWIKRKFSIQNSLNQKGKSYEQRFGKLESDRRRNNFKVWLKENGNPFEGKTHTEETKIKLSKIAKNRVITEEQKLKTKNTMLVDGFWSNEEKEKRSNRTKGDKNPKAKKLLFINPKGEEQIVYGSFQKFVDENTLSYYTAQKWIDRGVIPLIKGTNSEKTKNLIGWEIRLII